MPNLISKALAWKMSAFWFILFSVNSLCSCITAALVGTDWATLDAQSKLMIVIAVAGNWTGTIMAFIKQSAKKLEDGKLPFDDTATYQRTDVQQTTVQQAKPFTPGQPEQSK